MNSDSDIYLVWSEAVNFISMIFSVTMEYDQIAARKNISISPDVTCIKCIIVAGAVYLMLAPGPVSRHTKQNVYHCWGPPLELLLLHHNHR